MEKKNKGFLSPDGYATRLRAKCIMYGENSPEVKRMKEGRKGYLRALKIDKLLDEDTAKKTV